MIVDLDGIVAVEADIEDVQALRRAIWNTAQAAVAGSQPADWDREAINSAAAYLPPVPVLEASGRATLRRPVTTSQVLSVLARDAVDLFAGALAGRIRVCAAPDCHLLYVDRSRGGNRQWCSMQRCGTLAKVRAHRERHP